jgi:hypothetical protein
MSSVKARIGKLETGLLPPSAAKVIAYTDGDYLASWGTKFTFIESEQSPTQDQLAAAWPSALTLEQWLDLIGTEDGYGN